MCYTTSSVTHKGIEPIYNVPKVYFKVTEDKCRQKSEFLSKILGAVVVLITASPSCSGFVRIFSHRSELVSNESSSSDGEPKHSSTSCEIRGLQVES